MPRPVIEHSLGEPCDDFGDCEAGLSCVNGTKVLGCEGKRCCSPFCDHTIPNNCPGAPEQSCVPWYTQEEAPEGLENLGVCALP